MENLEERIEKVQKQIADVKKRWPFHSVKPALVEELEDLETELAQLLKEKGQTI